MSTQENQMLERLLEEAGFVHQGHPTRGLISAESAHNEPTTALRYRTLFPQMQEGAPTKDRIYEVPSLTSTVPGTPCIYFKAVDKPSAHLIANFRKRLWNHGRIPTLWIATPDSVLIYNSFARPQTDEENNPDMYLLRELHLIQNRVEGVQEFHKVVFDTGSFWKSGPGAKIDSDQRVDSQLLRDLSQADKWLAAEGLKPSLAHALLGRAIFIKYLEDRNILSPSDIRAHGKVDNFVSLLSNTTETYSFFKWLRLKLNGDLFPISQDEESEVTDRHLDIVCRFLQGDDMANYPHTQRRLWPYKFNIIPVELISSIYEMFAHSINPRSAEARSVHYTRHNLAELVMSLAMEGLHHTARVLDPACGSGVFLVEAFRYIAWRKEKEHGRSLNIEELREILCSQIFGIDIDRDAIYIAAFSLYLALLELAYDRPQSIDSLRLPPLIFSNTENDKRTNLYVQDFFNSEHQFNRIPPFSDRGFDLIVSNPPWTALTEESTPLDPDLPDTGHQWALEYCRREHVPDNKPDQAFMWRARDFSTQETRIALIVGSRLFHQTSPGAKNWRDRILDNFIIHYVVNLSDLRHERLLFGKTTSTLQPASIIVFSPAPQLVDTSLIYISPKRYPGVRQRDEILITSVDIQSIPQRQLRENAFLWKTAFRGTPRDFKLLARLLELPSLNKVLNEAKIFTGIHRGRGITFGETVEQRSASELRGLPYLGSDSPKQRYRIDTWSLPIFTRDTISSRSNRQKWKLPTLVLARALLDRHPCVALAEPVGDRKEIAISESYYGISFPRSTQLANRLNAILNSDLVLYVVFMLSRSLGWERDLIETVDWLRVPMPETIRDERQEGVWIRVMQNERWLREHWRSNTGGNLSEDLHLVNEELKQDIFALYDLSEQDAILIENTVKYTIEPYLSPDFSNLQPPTATQLRIYAQRICTQLNGILHYSDQELASIVFMSKTHTLNACRFALRNRSKAPLVDEVTFGDTNELLEQIAQNLRLEVGERLYVQRDLRVYDGTTFWIFKPAEIRLWTEASALNDADTVLREHMEFSPHG